ncbi:MAG TPA: tRNA (adenosine(37)-N6)-dimethylallyltransferase MiaA [Holophaga sp.]|nr:tRNA (adenosine(37)-N6)-dimethylallyltransferase MiaA [Holophaga sp.]
MKVAILGPTASGKSSLAVAVARRLGGTVVNGDPFQAVQGLAIGTGQPGTEEQGGVPHLGYGVQPLSEPMNPAGFGALVRSWIAQVQVPVLVTGSGLYLRGIWDQLDDLPDVPPALVAQVREWCSVLGTPRLHGYLAQVDPVRAAALHPNDASRVQRAVALFLATARPPSELLSGVVKGVPEGWKVLLVLPSRERQHARVRLRVRAMAAQGWRAEAQRIVQDGHEADLRRLRPLGYAHWLEKGTEDGIEARIAAETQAYAKRQSTWFRNQLPGLPTWDPDGEPLEAAFRKLGLQDEDQESEG